MITLSADEFKKRYGTAGIKAFTEPQQDPGYFSRVGSDIAGNFNDAVAKTKATPTTDKASLGQTIGTGLNYAKNLTGAAVAPIAEAPGFKQVGEAFGSAGKGISDKLFEMSDSGALDGITQNPFVKKASNTLMSTLDKHPEIGDAATTANNVLALQGVKGTVESVPRIARNVSNVARTAATDVNNATAGAVNYAKTAIKDIVPDSQRIINHQVSKGLDFTPDDLFKISESTGNDVGGFMSKNNLIGTNKATTQTLVEDFYKKNYESVRSEIKKVDDMGITHDAETIPGYKQATAKLSTELDGVVGLEKEAAEIKALAAKPNPTLADVQRVKEILDKHYNLYNAVGDVAQNKVKQGLANVRAQLRGYIEDTVKKNTGADIGEMNSNVATSRDISDTITQRDPKGLTRANMSMRDLGAFWFGSTFAGPLGGAALVFLKKVAESPTARLRVSRFVDQLSDARKAKIKADLEAGNIPADFNQFIKKKGSSTGTETPQKQ